MALTSPPDDQDAFTALRLTVEEYRDRLFSVLRNNDPLWVSGMRAKFIELEQEHRRAGRALEADLYHALSHAALRLHQTSQYNKSIADECACFADLAITTCRCPYESTNFDEENRRLQEVVTDALIKDWQRRGMDGEEATVAVALNNPFLLSAPRIR